MYPAAHWHISSKKFEEVLSTTKNALLIKDGRLILEIDLGLSILPQNKNQRIVLSMSKIIIYQKNKNRLLGKLFYLIIYWAGRIN